MDPHWGKGSEGIGLKTLYISGPIKVCTQTLPSELQTLVFLCRVGGDKDTVGFDLYAQSGKSFVLNTVLPAVLAKASIKASEMVVMRLNLSNMPCSQVRLVTLCLVSWFRGGGPTRCDIPSLVTCAQHREKSAEQCVC